MVSDSGEESSSWTESATWEIPGPILSMHARREGDVLAAGGDKRTLTLWDVETHQNTFKAKTFDPDFLNLKPAVDIRCVSFMPGECEQKVLIGAPGQVGTEKHKVLLYDTAASPRPVLDMDFGEASVTALCPSPDGRGCFVGDARGKLGYLDLRKGGLQGAMGGPCGSIRAIVHHPTLPYVASTGLDRHVRVHHAATRKLEAVAYVKQAALALAFDWKGAADVAAAAELAAQQAAAEAEAAAEKSQAKKKKKKDKLEKSSIGVTKKSIKKSKKQSQDLFSNESLI